MNLGRYGWSDVVLFGVGFVLMTLGLRWSEPVLFGLGCGVLGYFLGSVMMRARWAREVSTWPTQDDFGGHA